jgi:GT2 family glycosyltransferase
MSNVAVVILNFNGEKLLQQFLPSVIRYSRGTRIVVADNGSSDNSVHILNSIFPQVEVLQLDQNYGFCGGYNRALKQISSEYYVLLNSDIEVTEGWIEPVISLLQSDPAIAAVQPKVLSWHSKNLFEYAGAGGGFIDSLGYPFCRGRLFNSVEQDNHQYDDTRQIFWASGACLFIRSSVYQKFNGLDEDFFAHMEEIDLCWKINRTTDKVYYCGSSSVYHVGAGTLSYESPGKTFLNFRNGLTLIYKHLDTGELMWKFPLRILLDWAASGLFFIQGKSRNALSIYKAHYHFFREFRRNKQKRDAIRGKFPQYSRKNVYKGLALLSYFLKGRDKLKV